MQVFVRAGLGLLICGWLTATATTITVSVDNSTTSTRAGAKTVTFDGLAALSGLGSTYSDGVATYSWTGSTTPFVVGSVGGQYATPAADNTDYLSAGSPARPSVVDITFSTPIAYFGMYVGSPDSYNSITFLSGATAYVLTGGNLFGALANGNQQVGRYLNFDFSNGTIDQIRLASTQPAF